MAEIPSLKRLVKEDFDKDDQKLVDKLAFSLNPFMEQISSSYNKQINFDNLAQEIKTVSVIVDLTPGTSFATPKQQVAFTTTLTSKVLGISCIRAINVTNGITPVTSQPFVNFTVQGSIITITHVIGLPALSGDPTTSQKFNLTLLVYS